MKSVVFKICFAVLVLISVASCFEKEDVITPIPDNLYGTWSDQIGNRHIEFVFNTDNSGSFVYSSLAYYRVAGFTYYMRNGVVYCDGVCAHDDGDIEDPWHMELEYHADRLIPLNSYKEYTLRK